MIGSSVGTNVQFRCLKLADESGFYESLWTCGLYNSQEESHRFRFASDPDRYLAGQVFLRRMLGSWLDSAPQALQTVRVHGGKPRLDSPGSFNLSRCNSNVAVAVFHSGPFGVNTENRQEIPVFKTATGQVP
jgi:phosphopantetheinyl transferase